MQSKTQMIRQHAVVNFARNTLSYEFIKQDIEDRKKAIRSKAEGGKDTKAIGIGGVTNLVQ